MNNTEYMFTFYWLDGTVSTCRGYSVAHAFTQLGYGQEAINALDWYEEKEVHN